MLLVMQCTSVIFMKSAVKSVTVLENPNYYNGCHSKIKAVKTTFFSGGFSASRNFSAVLRLLLQKFRLAAKFGSLESACV